MNYKSIVAGIAITSLLTLTACNNTSTPTTDETVTTTTETAAATQKAANDLEKEMEAMTGTMQEENTPAAVVENTVEKISTTYQNPKQEVSMDIQYTLDADGNIETMEVSSANYDLSSFNTEIQKQVIGKAISDLDDVYVAGESLATDAFNDAIQ